MSYKDKLDFIRNEPLGIKRIGRIEYIKTLENKGMSKRQIQSQMLLDNVSKSVNMIRKDYEDYVKVADKVEWV